jgi:hypothetical protein
MMYELLTFETYLKEKAKPDPAEMDQEARRIENAWLAVLYAGQARPALEFYVRQHARALVDMLNREKKPANAHGLRMVSELLAFLERHGKPYWDRQLIAPRPVTEPVRTLTGASLPVLRSTLTRIDIDPALVGLLLADVQDLLDKPMLAYGQLNLLRQLVPALLELPGGQNDEIPDHRDARRELREILCRCNMNSLRLYTYATQQWRADTGGEQEDPVFRLLRTRQLYETITIDPACAYQPHRPALTDMLSAYLRDRIDAHRHQRHTPQGAGGGAGAEGRPIHTTLSIEKLGFFLRLFIDTDVFRVNNKRGLARFMAANLDTIGSRDNLEAASHAIYANLFTPSLKGIVGVIDIMDKMQKRAVTWKNAVKNTGKPPVKMVD